MSAKMCRPDVGIDTAKYESVTKSVPIYDLIDAYQLTYYLNYATLALLA